MLQVGKQCAFTQCRQLDFLPFQCASCANFYCQEHKERASHQCSAPEKQEKREISLERKNAIKCIAEGCKTTLTPINEFLCPECKIKVCMTHRFQESHSCSALHKTQKSAPLQQKEKPPKKKSSFFFGCCSGKPSQSSSKQKKGNPPKQ